MTKLYEIIRFHCAQPGADVVDRIEEAVMTFLNEMAFFHCEEKKDFLIVAEFLKHCRTYENKKQK